MDFDPFDRFDAIPNHDPIYPETRVSSRLKPARVTGRDVQMMRLGVPKHAAPYTPAYAGQLHDHEIDLWHGKRDLVADRLTPEKKLTQSGKEGFSGLVGSLTQTDLFIIIFALILVVISQFFKNRELRLINQLILKGKVESS